MYHPNIDMSGNICLDILKEEWSAVYNVQTILLSIQSMLAEPNPKSPLNAQYSLTSQCHLHILELQCCGKTTKWKNINGLSWVDTISNPISGMLEELDWGGGV